MRALTLAQMSALLVAANEYERRHAEDESPQANLRALEKAKRKLSEGIQYRQRERLTGENR